MENPPKFEPVLPKLTPRNVKTVTFSESTIVHNLENEDRTGPWEQEARDRSRFQRRIIQTAEILDPVICAHLKALDLSNVRGQGQSITTINGNGNHVATEVGANGWTTSVPVNSTVEGPMVSTTEKPAPTATSSEGGSKSGSKVHKFFKPILRGLATGATALLADSSFEVGLETSDRIDSTSHGNTIIQTQTAIPVQPAYSGGSGTPSLFPNPDLPTTPGPAAARSFLVDQFVWGVDVAISAPIYGPHSLTNIAGYPNCYPLPDSVFSSNPTSVFTKTATSHAFIHCGYEVVLQCNPSQFHAGALLLVAIPETIQFNTIPGPAQLFVYPHQILNLRTTNMVRLQLPYIGCTPTLPIGYAQNWSVHMFVLSPLQASAGTPQELNVTLNIAPLDVHFYGLRHQVTGQHLKNRLLPGAMAFGNVVAGQEIPLIQVAPSQPDCDWEPGEIHSWLEMAQIPCLYTDQVYWTAVEEAGALLVTFPISPNSLSGSNTLLTSISSFFSQWRGNLKVNLCFTGAKQQYGKLVVAYTPLSGGTAPTTIEEAMQATYTIWDIGLNSTLEFEIPFISFTAWKTVTQVGSDSTGALLGYFSVFVLNPLMGPSNVAPSAVILPFLSASSNYCLRFAQNPILGFQGDTQQLNNIEIGLPAVGSDLPEAIVDLPHPQPLETDLKYWFQQYRQVAVGGSFAPFPITTSNVLINLDPTTFEGNSFFETAIRAFTYVKGDLKVMLRYVTTRGTETTGYAPISAAVAFVPPGAAPNPLTQTNYTNNYSVETILPPEGVTEVCLRIPYSAITPVLPTVYNGYYNVTKTSVGHLDGATFGSIFITLPSVAGDVTWLTATAFFAIDNFRAWAPRTLPIVGAPTNTALCDHSLSLQNVTPKHGPRNPHYQAGPLSTDDPPVGLAYIKKCNRLTYVHWAIAVGEHQISLSQRGVKAYVELEKVCGVEYKRVPYSCFFNAWKVLGTEFYDYSATNNCTHFVEALTGESLYNTGTSISFALGAAATVACAGLIGVQTHLANNSALPVLKAPKGQMMKGVIGSALHGRIMEVTTPERVDKVLNSVSSVAATIEAVDIDRVTDCLENFSIAAANISDPDTITMFETQTTSLAESLREASDSIKGITTTLNDYKPLITGVTGNIFSRILGILVKIIGYIMIIFGSPTPLSIAGVITLIVGDLAPYLVERLRDSNPFTALYIWVKEKLGFKVTEEDCTVQPPVSLVGEGGDDLNSHLAGKQGWSEGLKDFNFNIAGLKNAEWATDKILAIAAWILEKCGYSVLYDPKKVFEREKGEIVMALYLDSIASKTATGLDVTKLQSNIAEVKDLLLTANKLNMTNYVTLLRTAVTNYADTLAFYAKAAFTARPEPVVVYLHGDPGIGKSIVSNALAHAICKALGKPPSDIYAPSSASEYFDSYLGQTVHIMDDLGQKPDGTDWEGFCNLVSSAPYLPPVADCDRKGTPYTSRVIIVPANFAVPNNASARCAAALKRRLHYKFTVETLVGNLDVAAALTPCGPAPRDYVKADFPLFNGTTLKLLLDSDSAKKFPAPDFYHLIDEVVSEVNRRSDNNDLLKHVVYQGKTVDDLVTESARLRTSVKDHFTKSAEEGNICCYFVLGTRKHKSKIAAGVMILSGIAALTTLIASIIAIRKATKAPLVEQAAYSGLNNGSSKKKPPPPPPALPLRTVVPSSGTLQYHGLPQISGKVRGAVHPIFNSHGGMSAFNIVGRVWVDPRRFTDHYTESFTLAGATYQWNQCKIEVCEELLYFRVPTGPMGKDMTKYMRAKPTLYGSGVMISNLEGYTSIVKATQMRDHGMLRTGDGITHSETVGYIAATYEGLCGAPLISQNPADNHIVGLHYAGYVGHSGFAAIFKLDSVRAVLAIMAVGQGLRTYLETLDKTVHIPRTTRLRPSPAAGAFEATHGPAVLTTRDPRLMQDKALDQTIFAKYVKDQKEMWPAFEPSLSHYLTAFQNVEIRTLTLLEAINGTPRLDGIDMSNSAGFPYNTMGISRKSLFDWDDTLSCWVPTPLLEADVNVALETPGAFLYTTFLKDELRSLEKISEGKTRVVESASLPLILAGRMLLGGLFEEMQSNPGCYGSAVGADPDVHWTQFYHSFVDYSRVYDLDYKNFDGSIPSGAFFVLGRHLANLIGDDEVRIYVEAIGVSKHVYGSAVVLMEGGMPSGCVGTSILNTILNNAFIISALSMHPDFNAEAYRILAYGDDVVYAHNPPIPPGFIKEFFDRNTPLEVTPASKAGDFNLDSTILDVTFLKRHFVPDPKMPVYIHPTIDPAVYQQSVMWVRDGDWQDTVTSLAQLAFHAGPNNYKNWVTQVLATAKLKGVLPNFPSFEFLQYRWILSLD